MLLYILSISEESDHNKISYLYKNFYDFMIKYSTNKFQSYGMPNFENNAEDAVQNTFMKISKHIKKIDFTVDKKRLKNYVFAILNNEISNILDEGPENLSLNEEAYTNCEYTFIEKLEIQENYDNVVAEIRRLDYKYSTTLILFYVEGKTVKEIAGMMGISIKTVYTRLERGRTILLNHLKGGAANE